MKIINLFFIAGLLFCSIITGCSKTGDAPSAGNDNNNSNNNKTYPAPGWQAINAATYAYSMTAVVSIPDSLQQTVGSTDELAAFIGNECRGSGSYVERGNGLKPVFYVLIKGAADEAGSVTFKYYNKKSSFMYSSGDILQFVIDDNYGTVDAPATPGFKPM